MSAVFLGAGLACIPLALRLPAVSVVSVAYLLISVENGLWNVAMATLRLSVTPDHMFGRMVASPRTVAQGTQPIGTLLGRILGATLGLVPTIVGGSVITMGSGLILARRDLWWAGRGDERPGIGHVIVHARFTRHGVGSLRDAPAARRGRRRAPFFACPRPQRGGLRRRGVRQGR